MSHPEQSHFSLKQKFKKIVLTSIVSAYTPIMWVAEKLYRLGVDLRFARDWKSLPYPEWFNHDYDLHYFKEQRKIHFFERGIYTSEVVRGKRVLDLCCGDGSEAALFISPLSKNVLALDFDSKAISHAKKNYSQFTNLEFREFDVRNLNSLKESFDVCIWDAAIEHFKEEEIHQILSEIKRLIGASGILQGYTNKKSGQAGHHEHELEFDSTAHLQSFLKKHFREVNVWERPHADRCNLYFRCNI